MTTYIITDKGLVNSQTGQPAPTAPYQGTGSFVSNLGQPQAQTQQITQKQEETKKIPTPVAPGYMVVNGKVISQSTAYNPNYFFKQNGKRINIDDFAKQLSVDAASGKISETEYGQRLYILNQEAEKSVRLAERINAPILTIPIKRPIPSISVSSVEQNKQLGFQFQPSLKKEVKSVPGFVSYASGKGFVQAFEEKKDFSKLGSQLGSGAVESVVDIVKGTESEAKLLVKPQFKENRLAVAAASVPVAFKNLALAPIQTGAFLLQGGLGEIPKRVVSLVDSPKKIGGLLITAIAFKGASKIPSPKFGSIGIPKAKLTELRGSTESFPLIKGGVKELQAKLLGGKTQTFLKSKFPEVFGGKGIIAIRTTTKTTTLKNVQKLAQYEEVAPFYGTDVSLIGLPQFKGAGQRVIPKISLFKAGSEKGMIEALSPKGFKLLPTTKTAKTISFTEYKRVSEFVGLKLENLGVAKKGLSRIRVKAGESILKREYSKVSSGARPFKLREIDVLTGGREATMKAFVEPKAKPGFVYPTRAFQLGATTESEVALFARKGVFLERVGAKGLRQKYLGYPSLIAKEGGEFADVRFYKSITAAELGKKGLIEKANIKLEQVRIVKRGEALQRYARGEVYEYRPLVTPTRTGLFNLRNKEKQVSLERTPETRLNVSTRESRTILRNIFIPVRKTERRIQDEVRGFNRGVSRESKVTVSEPVREIRVTEPPRKLTARTVLRTTSVRERLAQPTIRRTPYTYTRITTITPPPVRPVPVKPYPELRSRFRPIIIKKGFSVFSRVGGKAVQLGSNLPKNLAIAVGRSFTGGTTARSFKIKEVGFTSQADIGDIDLFQYRKPKAFGKVSREGFTFVEKSRFAINTPGEVRGLKVGKFKAKLFN